MVTADVSKAWICVGQDRTEPQLLRFAGGWATVVTCRSPGRHSPNEDAAVLIPRGGDSGVIAVADGCGGMAGGEHAARLAIETLLAAVQSGGQTDASLRSDILDGIEKANRLVRRLGTGAATTLAAAEIDQTVVRTYHVGDSAVLLVGNRGRIKLQTRSHSPVAYAVQAGVLSEEEAIHHEDRHLVSNVVGTADTHIDIGPRRRMSPRDTLLIASDGLFDNLHLEEIVQCIRKGPLVKAARKLAADATQRMETPDSGHPSKPDDLTFIVFRLRK